MRRKLLKPGAMATLAVAMPKRYMFCNSCGQHAHARVSMAPGWLAQ